jgi:hypothetical protein
LTVALVGGVVLAEATGDDGSGGSDEENKGFAARVEENTVADAVKQAKQEMYEEKLQAKLDALVESGRITQEEADEYKEWMDSRPKGIERLRGKGFGRHHGFRGKGFKCDKDDDDDDSDAESTST